MSQIEKGHMKNQVGLKIGVVLAFSFIIVLTACEKKEKEMVKGTQYIPVDIVQHRSLEVAIKEAKIRGCKIENSEVGIKRDGGSFTVYFHPKPRDEKHVVLGGTLYITVDAQSGKITKVTNGQ